MARSVPEILALGGKQEDQEFKVILGYVGSR